MAIYYFNASVISRSAGRSATASAAYRAAEKIKDSRTGEVHDYRKKKGVDEKIILAPEQAPKWVYNRQRLWNEVERVEHRINSQLAREIQVAIPRELNCTEQIELVKEYVSDLFVKEGMIADVTFHELSSHNPHAHIMLTMREIDEHGFKKNKNRDWNKRELLEKQRAAWSTYANHALEKAGVNEKIDHRTLAEQGINRIPQIHLGSAAAAMMKRGVATDKGDRWLEIEEANKRIQSLERSLLKVESEITAETKAVAEIRDVGKAEILNEQAKHYREGDPRSQYQNTAQLVRSLLGNNVSDPRLDLEIYLRVKSQSDIIKQSEAYQRLEKDDPKIAKCYLKAIAETATTYKSLSDRKTPDLDKWAKKLINSQLAKFYVQDQDQSQNMEQQQTRRRGLRM